MKKRILSLVLCAAMLLSMCVLLGAGVADSLTVCDSDGEAVSRVDLPVNQKLSLTVQAPNAAKDDAYQWQIQADKNVWANILGSDTQTLELSYPMVASLLSEENTVQIRCKLTVAATGETTYSDAVTVEVTAATAVNTTASADAAPVLRSAAKAQAATNDADLETYSIIINYVFSDDGTQAASPWTATVAKGSDYATTVTSPTVVGYTPDQESVEVNEQNIQANKTYTVTYQPAQVNFTVYHYQQNVDNDQYTLVETEATKTGYTGSAVGEGLAKDWEGFTALLYDTTTKIAADGSTVVKVYYDRNYYLMNFDLDGGYGVEPIYARYGAPISVDTPTKPGYAFGGWDPQLPGTMPAENSTHTATWTAGSADYTVVFWYENADDNGYSFVADLKQSATAGAQVSSDTFKNTSFTGRDATHFTYNSAKAETVTVAGDGSTVLNVYFTRNTYTLKFTDGTEQVLICGKEEHTHTYTGSYTTGGAPIFGIGATTYYYGGCYPDGGKDWGGATKGNEICGKEEHSHSKNKCYSNQPKVVKTITAKYGAEISSEFSKAPFTTTYSGRAWKCTDTSKFSYALQTLDRMPGFDATFNLYNQSSDTKKTIYYYVQKVGTTVSANQWPSNASNFDLLKQVDTYFNYATYDEEYHEIQGFTRYSAKTAGFNNNEKKFSNKQLNLYYIRNSYTLRFFNHDDYVAGKDATVQYEAPLSSYNFTPDYPANLEPNAYEFAGWYTTAACYAGSEADLSTMTMPASDVTLYAKWTPKTHTVTTWLTDAKDTPVNVGNTGSNVQTVAHGTQATKPTDPTNGNYTFVGWFYKENGVEKAFDFSMPVTKDLELYAKWSSNTLVEYTICYKLRDGTEIAPSSSGSALAGATKTFEAKTGTDLNNGYQSGYFPTTSSHSITMDINGGNEYTFIYEPKEEVNYTVRYLEKDTNQVLHEEKHGATRDAVITEKFEQITGYAPDAYQKRLVLSADNKQNVITFWYVKDAEHAPVQIIHWTQNIAGDGYTEYQSSTNLNGVIDKTYSETPLIIPGFQYNSDKGNASGELTADGLVLNLYYDRIEYPYEFRFVDADTKLSVANPVSGTARYQAQVTQTAQTIPGYALASEGNSQSMVIQIEDPNNVASKNVKTFYYRELTVDIKYVAVGSGELDNVQDSNVKVLSGTVKGSTPTANEGYKFVGWYKDAECTQPVDDSWVDASNKLTPHKSATYGDKSGYEPKLYYAKFERDVFDLKITKNVTGNGADPHQTFVFTVKNDANETVSTIVLTDGETKTIKGLPVGTYTVTEDTAWSWQYETVNPTQTVTPTGATATVTFTNDYNGTNWLTSFAEVINSWAKNTLEQTQVWPKN